MILKRLDDLGVAIDELTVDANEGVILGRGPLLKITDTKISRNHAKIIYDSEKQSLVFINTGKKPCYIKQTNEEKEFSFVEKDECIEIGGGYIFGLLPDQYIYEINGWYKIEKDLKKVSKVEVVNDVSDQEPTPGSSKKTNVDWEKHKENLNSEMVEMLRQKEDIEIGESEKENSEISEREKENKDENEKRPSCLYGKIGCARKNPQHFKEEAHPGDQDYIEIAQSIMFYKGQYDKYFLEKRSYKTSSLFYLNYSHG